jgi:hypothetical protein
VTSALQQVLQVTEEVGTPLPPVHSGATNSPLAPYFVMGVPRRTIAEQLISRLLACEAVVASHVEPSIALPKRRLLVGRNSSAKSTEPKRPGVYFHDHEHPALMSAL